MAIDPTLICCIYDDGEPAVAFVRESFVHARWEPCCPRHTQHFAASPHAKYQIAYLDQIDHLDPARVRGADPDRPATYSELGTNYRDLA